MLKRDVQATEGRCFKNSKSYVAKDGREVLCGRDWQDRKAELLARSEGRCEYLIPYTNVLDGETSERCTQEGSIPAHIEPRYPLRDDRMSNIRHLCLFHDRLTEKQAWRRVRSDKRERRANAD